MAKEKSHHLCNTSLSPPAQTNAQRMSEQHACERKVALHLLLLPKQQECPPPPALSTQKSGAATKDRHLQTVEGLQFRGRNGADWCGSDLKFQQTDGIFKEAVSAPSTGRGVQQVTLLGHVDT